MKSDNPLVRLRDFGQSIWLDFIRNQILIDGQLKSFISDDGVLGVTSNPSIFEKAISSSADYEEVIRKAALEQKTVQEIYQILTIHDIQLACDLFRDTYHKTNKKDGFVSLEVSPLLAYDTEKTVAQAKELWKKVSRPNLLVKIPATLQGVAAIKILIREGINVNATLLFSVDRYEAVAEAYISGLEARVEDGKSIRDISSVASFFLSRIDTAVDACLDFNSPLRGKIAIASAKVAYQKYLSLFESPRFKKLQAQGAFAQRLLWASTSTKNPDESDIKYVEALIGPNTVNTLPVETLNAYRDHGKPENRLETEVDEAIEKIELLKNHDIDLSLINQDLEDEGVHKFSSAYDKLMTSLELKRQKAFGKEPRFASISFFNFSDSVQKNMQRRFQKMNSENFVERIWQKDPSLWSSEQKTQDQIRNSLGWLQIAEQMQSRLNDEIKTFVDEITAAGFKYVVHMGMGGSSLAALVFSRSFSSQASLPLIVLDTTNPETIDQIEKKIRVEKTLFIVASKSGTTAEPLAFKDYFYERVRNLKGDLAGENFVAITDPDTPLVKVAKDQKFRKIFFGSPDIGGRYSALSNFGLLPASLMGVQIDKVTACALEAARLSRISRADSDCLQLGVALGEMALQKRDKVTLLIEEPLQSMGLWLEQLMAESTGKKETGLIPIAEERVGEPNDYGSDRLFVYVTCQSPSDRLSSYNEELKNSVSKLKEAGQAMIQLAIPSLQNIGAEFFNWEFATAVAGSILQINAFDQPNVQESKDITDKLLSETNQEQKDEEPQVKESLLSFYSNSSQKSGIAILTEFFEKSEPGDYLALMAFLPESPDTSEKLQDIRIKIRNKLKLATTLGYGPRFLHSTGQLHKGGPNTGLCIQLTSDDAKKIPIPGRVYGFGDFKNAQAKGDLEALKKHERRTLRIHLGANLKEGLIELEELVRVSLELK